MFNYPNDKDRMMEATKEYWLRITTAPANPAQPVDNQSAQITPANSRNCTAVVDDPNVAALPFVAMNAWLSPPVAVVFPGAHGAQGYNQVRDTTLAKHAEMKILDYFISAYGQPPAYIGVSKLCCLRCAMVLRLAGAGFQGSSGGLWNAGWTAPTWLLSSANALFNFMGDATTNFAANDDNIYNVGQVYNGLTSKRQSDYISSLQQMQN